ncbi:hypothetical protein BSPWISOXPB_2038 [uncultured Gammaproteobacteria bacterium]|nr:hypothetical protein BSPWISOXPB_2038 [uncultured Gammaproteobacteria bacterium]
MQKSLFTLEKNSCFLVTPILMNWDLTSQPLKTTQQIDL